MGQFNKLDEKYFIGSQPSEQDLHVAKQQGIMTVIDFRLPAETAASNATSNATLTRKHRLQYVNVPTDKANLSEQQIEAFENALHESDGPYLLHCATGTRALMVLALSKAKLQHWSAERVFEETQSIGFDLTKSPEFSAFVMQVTKQ